MNCSGTMRPKYPVNDNYQNDRQLKLGFLVETSGISIYTQKSHSHNHSRIKILIKTIVFIILLHTYFLYGLIYTDILYIIG